MSKFTIDFGKKVVVVTGGNKGLGYGIAQAVASANATVAIIYNSATNAAEVASKLSSDYGVPVKAYQANVGDAKAVADAFTAIEKDLGQIHSVVANSGVSVLRPATELTKEDFYKVFDVNVVGVFHTAQAAARLWIPRKHAGKIVVVSSMSSEIINWPLQQVFYNSSKAAVSNLVKGLAVEWAEHGILVNAVCPGFINTDQTSHMDAKLREGQAKAVPLGRFSEPYEQAGQVVFLLSDYATYQTASNYFNDGGYTAL